MYAASSNFFSITGDPTAYRNAFGSSRVEVVSNQPYKFRELD